MMHRVIFFLENCMSTPMTLFWIKTPSGADQSGCWQMGFVRKKLNLSVGMYSRTQQGPRQGLWRTRLIPPTSLLCSPSPINLPPAPPQRGSGSFAQQWHRRPTIWGAFTELPPQPGERKIIAGKRKSASYQQQSPLFQTQLFWQQ